MARPKKDEPKLKFAKARVTEEDREKLYSLARNRGITFSAMLLQDYLQQKPKITFAAPDRERMIKLIHWTSNIVSQFDKLLAELNPENKNIMELVPFLTEAQLRKYQELESGKQGALVTFLELQSELNGRHKG